MLVHQPEHLGHGRLAVGHDRPGEEIPHQRIERDLVALGVGTSGVERLLINRQGQVLHLHMLRPHMACVHRQTWIGCRLPLSR